MLLQNGYLSHVLIRKWLNEGYKAEATPQQADCLYLSTESYKHYYLTHQASGKWTCTPLYGVVCMQKREEIRSDRIVHRADWEERVAQDSHVKWDKESPCSQPALTGLEIMDKKQKKTGRRHTKHEGKNLAPWTQPWDPMELAKVVAFKKHHFLKVFQSFCPFLFKRTR